MKDSNGHNASRRNFLVKTLKGTGLIVTGTLMPNLLKANSKYESRKPITGTESLRTGVFPFYEYAHKYNFGEFIPKDQGGKFIQMEMIRSEKDVKIVDIITNGLIDKQLGNPPDWAIFEKTELEKSVWINRFYYLPSFARLYYLDKNTEHVEFIMQFLSRWIKDNPPKGPSNSKYNWFDMQVAWRSINLSWCYYLAGDGLTEQDKETIYALQGEHAKILMKDFGKKELNEFNHQSHGALAILYLALLFPSLPESEGLLKTGLKIINHHVENAFYPDGGNVEQMFGYYPFMTSVIRDAYLLCKANNVGNPESMVPLLKKMYTYLSVIAQPDNTVPPINDSYEETVSFILPTLAGILGEANLPEPPRSDYFPDSEIGVLRSDIESNEQWYINVNAAKLIGSHGHAGRLAFNLWYNNNPVMVDSGCCNYDNPLLVEWYRTSEAHNTVLIDDKSDFATSQREVQWAGKRYTDNVIECMVNKPGFKFIRMLSPESDETNSGVKWVRDLILVNDRFTLIHDLFESSERHDYTTIFRFADLKVSKTELNGRLLIETGNGKLAVIPVSDGNNSNLTVKEDYFGSHAKNIRTPTADFNVDKNGTLHSTFLIKPVNSGRDIQKISLSQSVDQTGCTIKMKNEDGEEIDVNIKNAATNINDTVRILKD